MGLLGRSEKPGRRERKAAEVVEREVSTQARYEAQAAAKRAELESMQARASGELVAAGEGGDAVASRLATDMQALRLSVDAYTAEAAAAEQRAEAARREVTLAQAADRRAEAQALTAEADRRQIRTDELLASLREHEGADYMPWRLDEQDLQAELQRTGSAPAPHVPQTQMLRDQAAELVAEAERLEAGVLAQTPPVAVASAGLDLRLVDDLRGGLVPYRRIGEAQLVELVLIAGMSPGTGPARTFALRVDDVDVTTSTLLPGQSKELVHVLGKAGAVEPGAVVRALVDAEVVAEHRLGPARWGIPMPTLRPVDKDAAAAAVV